MVAVRPHRVTPFRTSDADVELTGRVIVTELSGSDFGEDDDLTIKADLTRSGTLIPEPTSPALTALMICPDWQ